MRGLQFGARRAGQTLGQRRRNNFGLNIEFGLLLFLRDFARRDFAWRDFARRDFARRDFALRNFARGRCVVGNFARGRCVVGDFARGRCVVGDFALRDFRRVFGARFCIQLIVGLDGCSLLWDNFRRYNLDRWRRNYGGQLLDLDGCGWAMLRVFCVRKGLLFLWRFRQLALRQPALLQLAL